MGASFAIDIAVTNTGSSDVTDATADVTLSGGTQLVGTQGAMTCTGSQTVHCALAPIPAGASRSYALTAKSASPGQAGVSATVNADGSTASSSSTLSIYTLELRSLTTTPAVAGTPFTASQTLVRSDTGAPVRPWSAACPAAIASAPKGSGHPYLSGRLTRHGSRLTCSWQLPRGSSGKYVRALIQASSRPGGIQTKYPFWRRIS
jgi:hypothetical protein